MFNMEDMQMSLRGVLKSKEKF
jgi:hypothetical protein